MPSKGLKQLTF